MKKKYISKSLLFLVIISILLCFPAVVSAEDSLNSADSITEYTDPVVSSGGINHIDDYSFETSDYDMDDYEDTSNDEDYNTDDEDYQDMNDDSSDYDDSDYEEDYDEDDDNQDQTYDEEEDFSQRPLYIHVNIEDNQTFSNIKFIEINGTITTSENISVVDYVDMDINDTEYMVDVDEDGFFSLKYIVYETGFHNVKIKHYSNEGYVEYNTSFVVESINTTRYDSYIVLADYENISNINSFSLKGKVYDDKNNPLSNVDLTLECENFIACSQTDDYGVFTFTGISDYPGVYNCVLYVDDLDYTSEQIDVSYTIENRDVEDGLTLVVNPPVTEEYLEEAIIVSGYVTDSQGNPVEGVLIKIIMYDEDYATTDENGEFYHPIQLYDYGTYTLKVLIDSDKYYDDAYTTNITVKAHQYSIELDQLPDTLDIYDDLSITGHITSLDGYTNMYTPIIIMIDDEEFTTYTDDGGMFSFDYSFEDIGEHTINVSVDENSIIKTVNVVSSQKNYAYIVLDSSEDIYLNQTNEIYGYVYDEDDNFIANTTVVLTDDENTYNIDTDDEGYFYLELFVEDTTSLMISLDDENYMTDDIYFNIIDSNDDNEDIDNPSDDDENTNDPDDENLDNPDDNYNYDDKVVHVEIPDKYYDRPLTTGNITYYSSAKTFNNANTNKPTITTTSNTTQQIDDTQLIKQNNNPKSNTLKFYDSSKDIIITQDSNNNDNTVSVNAAENSVDNPSNDNVDDESNSKDDADKSLWDMIVELFEKLYNWIMELFK